jgi:multicomponent Na+:H+ antiporter subunit D
MNILPLFTSIALAGAFVITLLGKRRRLLPDMLGNAVTLCLLCLSFASLLMLHRNGTLVYTVGGWVPPVGIALVLDGLSAFMLVTVNGIAVLVTIYSISYMERYTDKWKFYALFLLMLGGMNGVIVTGDMFNLFVFLEIAAIASYALVAFGTEREELEAGFKYMVMGNLASCFILLGIVFLYSYTSTLNMADMSLALAGKRGSPLLLFVSAIFLMGFGLKAALMPFHAWLPDAHPSAPAPISAMLSGVLIKVLGVYAIMRVFFSVLGVSVVESYVLMVLGSVSMIAGACLAIGQTDIKRMLAYSSISQVGYIFLGLGLGTPLGFLGALLHLINHAVFKSLLFLNSGAVEYATGTRDLRKMGGLSQKLPVTGATNFVGAMSISGLPPLGGFWSKLIIIMAAVWAGHLVFAIVAAAVSILTIAYYARLQRQAFFGDLDERWSRLKEVPGFMRFAMVVLAILCIFGGLLLLPPLSRPFLDEARGVLQLGTAYSGKVFSSVKANSP